MKSTFVFGIAALISLSTTAFGQGGRVCYAGPGYQACEKAAIQANIDEFQHKQALGAEKDEMMEILAREIREAKDPNFLVNLSDGELAGYMAKLHVEADRLAAIRVDLKMAPATPDGFFIEWERLVTKEKACRADTKCMADRQAAELAKPLCVNVAQIRFLQDRIKTEKANPSGVVDLADLHSTGEDIQIIQARLANNKAAYFAATKRAFDEKTCK
jgi:hypothetical protein